MITTTELMTMGIKHARVDAKDNFAELIAAILLTKPIKPIAKRLVKQYEAALKDLKSLVGM